MKSVIMDIMHNKRKDIQSYYEIDNEYLKLCKEIETLYSAIESKFLEQKYLIEKIRRLFDEKEAVVSEFYFAEGFKTGMQLGIEVENKM